MILSQSSTSVCKKLSFWKQSSLVGLKGQTSLYISLSKTNLETQTWLQINLVGVVSQSWQELPSWHNDNYGGRWWETDFLKNIFIKYFISSDNFFIYVSSLLNNILWLLQA